MRLDLGVSLARHGSIDEAIREFDKSRLIAASIGDENLSGVAARNLAVAHRSKGEDGDAHALAQEAVGLFESHGDWAAAADAMLLELGVSRELSESTDLTAAVSQARVAHGGVRRGTAAALGSLLRATPGALDAPAVDEPPAEAQSGIDGGLADVLGGAADLVGRAFGGERLQGTQAGDAHLRAQVVASSTRISADPQIWAFSSCQAASRSAGGRSSVRNTTLKACCLGLRRGTRFLRAEPSRTARLQALVALVAWRAAQRCQPCIRHGPPPHPQTPPQTPTPPRQTARPLHHHRPTGLEGEGFPGRRAFAGVDLAALDPFVHMDQMGEIEYAPGEPKGTPWHPHRGFETVTYMLDGIIQHQDSNGGGGMITDGDTQWMTAGRGAFMRRRQRRLWSRVGCSTASSCG